MIALGLTPRPAAAGAAVQDRPAGGRAQGGAAEQPLLRADCAGSGGCRWVCDGTGVPAVQSAQPVHGQLAARSWLQRATVVLVTPSVQARQERRQPSPQSLGSSRSSTRSRRRPDAPRAEHGGSRAACHGRRASRPPATDRLAGGLPGWLCRPRRWAGTASSLAPQSTMWQASGLGLTLRQCAAWSI